MEQKENRDIFENNLLKMEEDDEKQSDVGRGSYFYDP